MTIELAGARPDVVVFGRRRGLMKALEASNLSYVLIEKPASAQFGGPDASLEGPEERGGHTHPLQRAAWIWDGDNADAVLESVAGAFAGRTAPAAVLASKEWTVMPAARLRSRLGIEGVTEGTALLCTNKFRMKEQARAAGIAVTDSRPLTADTDFAAAFRRAAADWRTPVVLKPQESSGSRGIRYLSSVDECAAPLPAGSWLLEKFVDAPEASVESFIVGGEAVFCNITQYFEKRHVNIVPSAGIDCPAPALLELNRRVIAAMGIERGIAHAEFYLTASGPVFGEIAVRPPGGYIMDLLQMAYGMDPWLAWITAEFGGPAAGGALPSPLPRCSAAAHVLHPGAGIVKAVIGFEDLVPSGLAVSGRLRLKAGDSIPARAGLGSDYGVIFQAAPDADAILRSVLALQTAFRIEME